MPPVRLIPHLVVAVRHIVKNDQFVLAGLAVILGAAASLGAIAFRYLLAATQYVTFGHAGEDLASHVAGLPWWWIILGPTAGGLAVGLMIKYWMPDQRPQGVPHVMEACALKGGRMSLKTGVAAAVVSATSLGFGASTGREGPVVHLGATMGAWLAKTLRMSANLSRTLLGCGVAAAVAASFNAPIAGVFFALEVVVGHYALSAFAPIVIASVTGTIITRLHYGDFPAFVLPQTYQIVSFLEFPAFALLGLVSAVVAIVFMWSVITAENVSDKSGIPPMLRPVAGGLVLGLTALAFPEILGVGYEATDAALRESLDLWLLFTLIAVKVAATAISIGSRFGGGVFSPSLFLGAMTGGAFGVLATHAFPELSSGHGAYTLVGMGAVAAAVLGAPMSTILIVFEMTGDYELTIALMVAVVVATVLTQLVTGRSLFTWQLERRGVSLKGGREIGLLSQIRVADIMKNDYVRVPPEAPVADVTAALHDARYGEVFVIEPDDRLVGIITVVELAHLEGDQAANGTARDAARLNPPILEAAQDIRHAMSLMDRAGESHIPVVDNAEARRVVGFVHEHDVMLAYHRALLQARAEERGDPIAPVPPGSGRSGSGEAS